MCSVSTGHAQGPRNERYQISEFGSIIIYTIYRDVPQVLTLLVGQNDPSNADKLECL